MDGWNGVQWVCTVHYVHILPFWTLPVMLIIQCVCLCVCVYNLVTFQILNSPILSPKSSSQTPHAVGFLVTCGGICKVAETKSPAVKSMQDSSSNVILISISTGTTPWSWYGNEITLVCFYLMFGVWSESEFDLHHSATLLQKKPHTRVALQALLLLTFCIVIHAILLIL